MNCNTQSVLLHLNLQVAAGTTDLLMSLQLYLQSRVYELLGKRSATKFYRTSQLLCQGGNERQEVSEAVIGEVTEKQEMTESCKSGEDKTKKRA